MATVVITGEIATAAMEMQRGATPSRCTTTLYDLMTAIQDVVGPENDALAVATMVHLLQSGRLTWLRTDHALRCAAHGVVSPAARRLSHR